MRNKSLFLLIAGVCGTIAAIGVGQWMNAKNGSNTIEMVEILVTTQAINPEEQITADKLRLEQWPADRIPAGSSADLTSFEGRYAKVPLFAGEPMLDLKLMNEVEDKVVPEGYTVVSLPAGRDGTINLVKPGDRVDLRGFFTKGENFAQDMSLDILTGVRVYAIDGITKFEEDAPRRTARDIQLLIRKADIEAFDFATKMGEIKLSLGSPRANTEAIPEGEPSPEALKFITDLQERRDEQERLRLAKQKKEPAEPVVVVAEKKKPSFIQKKIVNGRIMVYEWIEGEPLPRLVGDTGAPEGTGNATDGNPGPSGDSSPQGASNEDFLRGMDSPFFTPSSESGAES